MFVEAGLYRYGIPWRDLPKRFGDWKNVHRRSSRWGKTAVWEKVIQHLAAVADNEYAMIDGTIVRAHQHSAGAVKNRREQAIGRSRGGLSTKIHTLVDALGNPVGFVLTGGQAHDLDCLLADMQADTLIADKAYDADVRVLGPLAERARIALIPPKANRKQPREYDRDTYKTRYLIENFFAKAQAISRHRYPL